MSSWAISHVTLRIYFHLIRLLLVNHNTMINFKVKYLFCPSTNIKYKSIVVENNLPHKCILDRQFKRFSHVSFRLLQTCGVVDLRSSNVVPPLLLNLTLQLRSGCVIRFCCLDGRSMIYLVNLSSSRGTTSIKSEKKKKFKH